MSGLETAIKQALERSDRASAETRARIYQSARNALEAGLRKQNVHDDTVVAQQRHRLEVAIHAIEQQERAMLRAAELDAVVPDDADRRDVEARTRVPSPAEPRAPDVQPAPTSPESPLVVAADRHGRAEPSFGAIDAPAPSRVNANSLTSRGLAGRARGKAAPSVDPSFAELNTAPNADADDAAPAPMVAPMRDGRRPAAQARDADNDFGLPGAERVAPRRRRSRGGRIASFLMVVAVLVAAIGSATWWVMSTGLLDRPQTPGAPPPTAAASDFDGSAGLRTLGAQAGFASDWLDLYMPTASGGVTPGARVRTETVRDEGGERLRIVSGAGDASGSVAIEVPALALERMSGKTSTIAFSVQSATGKPTQFSVECDFASLGDCGRHRFTVNDEKSDMLFKVTFDRTLSPSGPGRIFVNSDVTANGGGLDLYGVRLLPGQ